MEPATSPERKMTGWKAVNQFIVVGSYHARGGEFLSGEVRG